MDRCTCVEHVIYGGGTDAHTCAICGKVKVVDVTQLRDYQQRQRHRGFQQHVQDRLQGMGFVRKD